MPPIYWYYNIDTLCTPGHYCGCHILLMSRKWNLERTKEQLPVKVFACVCLHVCACVCVSLCVFACICVCVCVLQYLQHLPLSVAPWPHPFPRRADRHAQQLIRNQTLPSTMLTLSHITTLQTFLFGWVLSFIMFSWIHLEWGTSLNCGPWTAVLILQSYSIQQTVKISVMFWDGQLWLFLFPNQCDESWPQQPRSYEPPFC
jgi:hypothetical protein